jgi:GT2 family glycosyltransferase
MSFFLTYNNKVIIYLVDNSPNNFLRILEVSDNIKYIYVSKNIGFGAAHNLAINEALKIESSYHFVINPDIIIKNDVINPMINFLDTNKNVGLLMPQILNIDGTVQFLPKLLPSPSSIIKRKIHLFLNINSKFLNNYELRFYQENNIIEIPVVSGCFMLINLEAVKKAGLFDVDFFMYFEDWDFSRRINAIYKTIYMPALHVFHHYESGANKKFILLLTYLNSGVKYFNKWGWFFDKNRDKINKNTLRQFK